MLIDNNKKSATLAVIALSVFVFGAAKADDWENLYKKFEGKTFDITYNQTKYYLDGSVKKRSPHYRISLTSPNGVRYFAGYTDMTTNEVKVLLDVSVAKNDQIKWGEASFDTFEVKKNTIINYSWMKGAEVAELQITTSGNNCSAKWENEDPAALGYSKVERSPIICKVISQ